MWITERCHMNAERRNRRYELYFHLLLAFYSIAAIGHQILSNGKEGILGSDVFLFLSVCTLSLSLLIFGFKFGETAAQHRACYLKLQDLRHQFMSIEELNESYVSAIGSLPNHTKRDFHNVVIGNVFKKTQELQKSDGSKYELSIWARVKYVFQEIFLLATSIAAFLPPIVVLLEPIVSSWYCK